MTNLIYLTLLLICATQTSRAVFVMTGMYKDPVLAKFEHFGEDEPVFSPILNIAVWGSALLYLLLFLYFPSGMLFVLGIMIGVTFASARFEILEFVRKRQNPTRMFPDWYADLSQRTTREERRRIAYMWLRLPPRTRLIYNTSTPYFMHWVDQVLITIA